MVETKNDAVFDFERFCQLVDQTPPHLVAAIIEVVNFRKEQLDLKMKEQNLRRLKEEIKELTKL